MSRLPGLRRPDGAAVSARTGEALYCTVETLTGFCGRPADYHLEHAGVEYYSCKECVIRAVVQAGGFAQPVPSWLTQRLPLSALVALHGWRLPRPSLQVYGPPTERW